MKNLKKVLALGLALVMLLGMFTVVSAAETKKTASDLTDWETVQHQDAVSLMVDLGIINGMPDGSFAPTGNIDRASWAKMVYYAATGSDNADAYLGSASGLNDIAGNWAESYISYLKAGNFISGDNYGNYNPSANVTVAEACKMMLTTLGYDADDRGYQYTAAWAGNIMTDAKRNGLLDNLDSSMTTLAPLTRENAAELVLNTLNANTVFGESRRDQGEKYIVSYTYGPTLGYDVFNMVKVTAIVDEVDADGMAVVTTVTDPAGFNIFGQLTKNVKASPSITGEEANFYVKADGMKFDKDTGDIITTNGAFKSVISTTAAKAATTPVRTFTAGVTMANVIDRSNADYVAPAFAANCAYYLNGALDKSIAHGDSVAAAGLRGSVVEFYLNDAGNISVVKVYKYTVKQVEGAVATKTLSDGTLQVRVPGITGGSYVDADKITGWQGLEVDDVVLYYTTALSGATSATAYTIEKADKVSGKVSTYSNGGALTVNGKSYRASEQSNVGKIGDISYTDTTGKTVFSNWGSNGNLVDEYDFYLDKNGDVMAIFQITENMDNTKVCMVIETEVTDGSMGSSGALAANLLFVDGSTEIVKVSKVSTGGNDAQTVVDDGKLSTNESTKAKQIEATKAQEAIAGKKNTLALTKFFNYKATSSGYELTELGDFLGQNLNRNWENAKTGTDFEITKAKAAFASKTEADKTVTNFALAADASTTFIMGKEDRDGKVVYTVVKGIKNIHEMTASIVTGIAVNEDPSKPSAENTVAKYVYLGTTKFSDDAPDGFIFIVDNNWKADSELAEDGVVLVNIVDTDGTVSTMRVNKELKAAIASDKMALSASTNFIRKFWAVMDVDEDKVVHELGDGTDYAVTTKDAEGNITKVDYAPEMLDLVSLGNDVISVGSVETATDGTVTTTVRDTYTYDESTKFVYVDMAWADDTDDAANKLGVREATKDKWVIESAGKITNVNGFYKSGDVDDRGATGDDAALQNPSGATYIEVLATVIQRDGTDKNPIAEYVYVVRYLW